MRYAKPVLGRKTMSGFTYIIIGGVLALIGSVLATVGGSKLKRTEEALSLSVPPSIEITIQANATSIPDIVVENTGQHELTNLRLSPISYVIAKEPMKVLYRLPRLSLEIAKSLKPREKVTIPANKIDFHAPAELLNDKTIKMIAMVVVFRRQLDNKRYVEIEPFITETIEGHYLPCTLIEMAWSVVRRHLSYQRSKK
jgi:hypothetical protein